MTCSCVIAMSGFEPSHIEFCRLHKAAPEMLEANKKSGQILAEIANGNGKHSDEAMGALSFVVNAIKLAEGAQS